MIIDIDNSHSTKELCSFALVFDNAGSMFETSGNEGVSHFMEHLLSHGLDPYMAYITEHGIMFNACTSKNYVAFFMYGLEKHVSKFIPTFIDSITNYQFTKSKFETEKEIILAEIYKSLSNSVRNCVHTLYEKHFGIKSTIGSVEVIKEFKYEKALALSKFEFACPTRIININSTSLLKIIDNIKDKELRTKLKYITLCCDLQNSIPKKSPKWVKNEKFTNGTKIEMDKGVLLTQLKTIPLSYKAEASLALSCLYNGFLSPIMKALRSELGLVYSLENSAIKFVDGIQITSIGTTRPDATEKLLKEWKKLLRSPSSLITKDIFLIFKNKRLCEDEMHIYDMSSQLFHYIDDFTDVKKVEYKKLCYVADRYLSSSNFYFERF
jgi:predicted Zn-dependent peptidase